MKKALFIFFTTLFISAPLFAQQRGRGRQINYASLANRAATPVFFFEEVTIPGKTDSTTTIAFIFRMDNNFLPFKKIHFEDDLNQPEGYEFFSTARINSEIFKGELTKKSGLNSTLVYRDAWQDTMFAKTFDDTQSKNIYTSGILTADLAPGFYNYLLQLSMMEETNDRNSTRRNIRIENLSKKKTGEIHLIKTVQDAGTKKSLTLLNMGDNVLYGKDFFSLVRIPNYDANAEYSIEMYKAQIGKKDTTNQESVFKTTLSNNDIFDKSTLTLEKSSDPSLILKTGAYSFTYALVKIPNAKLENSLYKIVVKKEGDAKPFATRLIRSYWPDMPPSLLNLDIAIDMLKYIIPEKSVDALKKGSDLEKETKFREFWASKDPTPETEYNELMSEYYRRVDYAFKEFRNPENPDGQDTDRGTVYIKYGPPISTERQFPSKGRVLETWKYKDRTFVFEKGAGFSDFILLGK